jgi:hypothetical protein
MVPRGPSRYPKLPPHLAEKLSGVTPSGDAWTTYYPCCVRLNDGTELDRVYIVAEIPFIKVRGIYPIRTAEKLRFWFPTLPQLRIAQHDYLRSLRTRSTEPASRGWATACSRLSSKATIPRCNPAKHTSPETPWTSSTTQKVKALKMLCAFCLMSGEGQTTSMARNITGACTPSRLSGIRHQQHT